MRDTVLLGLSRVTFQGIPPLVSNSASRKLVGGDEDDRKVAILQTRLPFALWC